MEKITIEEWPGGEFHFDCGDVKSAETDGEVLEALKDYTGVNPYSPVRCAIFAETPEGKKIVQEMRRICEGGGDKKVFRKRVRKTPDNKD